ncbi:hypothetical protein Tco_1261225, partial [Tanacetum coccineum]
MTIPAIAEEKTYKKNDVKARSLLLMSLPNEHQLTFDQYEDAQSMLQKLVSRLAILGVVTPLEDLNLKFLRSVPVYNGDKNLAFVTTSGTSSTNNTNTAIPKISTASTKVNTASTKICTAIISDATVYAFMSTQPKGSQLVHEDLEQLHDDDLEEIDLKWNMALLSMRARKFYQRTRRKIIIDGSNTTGYDKSKIEDTSEKAMMAIDGVSFDWSDMAEEQKQYDDLLVKLNDTEFKAATYKRGLATLEDQIITYKKNEVLFSEEVDVLKREVGCKEYELGVLRSELEKVKQEKDGIEFKITKFDKSAKDLDEMLESQRSDKNKQGLGFNVIAPPHPLTYNRPTKLDLSYSGLDEFKEPEINGLGPREFGLEPTIVCNKESDNSE